MATRPPDTSAAAASRVLEVADELYALRLEEFVPTRDQYARALKGEEAAAAATVGRLRKPSVAAWVVNLFVRHETEQVAQMLQVGEQLRQAQAGLDGEELRALTRQRRQLTAALTTQARRLATAWGRSVSSQVAEQVETTLTAAMVDPACAEAVRSGVLVGPLQTTGMGEEDVGAALALPEALGFVATAVVAPDPAPGDGDGPGLHLVGGSEDRTDEQARAAAREAVGRRLAAADEDLSTAASATARAEQRVEELQSERLRLGSELTELRTRLAALEERAETTEEQLVEAESSVGRARETESTARAARDEAAAERDRLG